MNREGADRSLDRPGAGNQVPHETLGRAHADLRRMSTEAARTAAHSLLSFMRVDVP